MWVTTMPRFLIAGLCVVTLCVAGAADAARAPKGLTADAVNSTSWSPKAAKRGVSPLLIKTQVLLDRRGFSPGAIDGRRGDNLTKALRAFQQHSGLNVSGQLDQKTWDALSQDAPEQVLMEYQISKADVSGPFTPDIPEKFEEKAALKRLGYRDSRELLAEKFHMDDDLLGALNRGRPFGEAGTAIVVANVQTPSSSLSSVGQAQGNAQKQGGEARRKAARIEIDKKAQSLRAFDSDGRLLAFYPATIGSTENPAPSGRLEVVSVAQNPTYYYRPSLNFKGVSDRSFKIVAGPNNPVGAVWIDLSKEGYGIHGTPEPAKVSKTASHGCVRLTNWDVRELSEMVQKGVSVEFIE